MLEIRRATLVLVALASAGAFPSVANAQDGWSVEVGTEPSAVDIGSRHATWWTNRIRADYREPSVGGLFLAAESQRRESLTDEVLSAGGYRRLDDWTLSGQAAVGVNPDFLPRLFLESQVGRRLFGTFVAQVGYQYRSYAQSRIHIWSLAGIQYFANGEIEARVDYGRNEPLDRPIRVFKVRALWDDGSALSFGGAVAVGQNLYDALNVPGVGENNGWVVNANARYRVDARNSVRLDLTAGREDPSFRQRSLGLSYRRAF